MISEACICLACALRDLTPCIILYSPSAKSEISYSSWSLTKMTPKLLRIPVTGRMRRKVLKVTSQPHEFLRQQHILVAGLQRCYEGRKMMKFALFAMVVFWARSICGFIPMKLRFLALPSIGGEFTKPHHLPRMRGPFLSRSHETIGAWKNRYPEPGSVEASDFQARFSGRQAVRVVKWASVYMSQYHRSAGAISWSHCQHPHRVSQWRINNQLIVTSRVGATAASQWRARYLFQACARSRSKCCLPLLLGSPRLGFQWLFSCCFSFSFYFLFSLATCDVGQSGYGVYNENKQHKVMIKDRKRKMEI